MNIEYNWHVYRMERESSDGYVFEAFWKVFAYNPNFYPEVPVLTQRELDEEGPPVSMEAAMELAESKIPLYNASTGGSTKFARPDSLIPYEDLTEAQVVQWVKDELGANKVAEIEGALAAAIAEQENASIESGTPW
jgi:hypothetical protein